MRTIILAAVFLTLGGCDDRRSLAEQIVTRKLGQPETIAFRALRTKGDERIVCGEVEASDQPGGGWRYFAAYVDLNDAAIAPPGGVSAAGEMGKPGLAGEADRFNSMCDG